MIAPSAAAGLCGQVFFAGLWQGAALAIAVAIGLRLSPRTSAAVRFLVWTLAFVVALVAPLLGLSERPGASSGRSAATLHLDPTWGYAVVGVWATLTLYRAARLAVHLVHLRRMRQNATPILLDNQAHQETIALLHRAPRPVSLYLSADVDSPSVIGFRSARLFIPAWLFARLTPADLRQVVLHELEHVRRRDSWINLIQKVGMALFPLSPALLWMDRRLSIERELACDAGVVARTAEPLEYARCLTRLAEYRLRYRRLALALAAWGRRSELGRRVQCLLRQEAARPPRRAGVAAVLLSLAIVGVGAEMTRAPRLVSFSDAGLVTTVAALPAIPAGAEPASIPVAYRLATQPRAMLVNAIMPAAGLRPVASAAKTMSPATYRSRSARHRSRPRLLTAGMSASPVATTPKPSRRPIARAIYVIDQFPPSYAAVPFADGWLIVKL